MTDTAWNEAVSHRTHILRVPSITGGCVLPKDPSWAEAENLNKGGGMLSFAAIFVPVVGLFSRYMLASG